MPHNTRETATHTSGTATHNARETATHSTRETAAHDMRETAFQQTRETASPQPTAATTNITPSHHTRETAAQPPTTNTMQGKELGTSRQDQEDPYRPVPRKRAPRANPDGALHEHQKSDFWSLRSEWGGAAGNRTPTTRSVPNVTDRELLDYTSYMILEGIITEEQSDLGWKCLRAGLTHRPQGQATRDWHGLITNLYCSRRSVLFQGTTDLARRAWMGLNSFLGRAQPEFEGIAEQDSKHELSSAKRAKLHPDTLDRTRSKNSDTTGTFFAKIPNTNGPGITIHRINGATAQQPIEEVSRDTTTFGFTGERATAGDCKTSAVKTSPFCRAWTLSPSVLSLHSSHLHVRMCLSVVLNRGWLV